jgi:GLPGLI family protein
MKKLFITILSIAFFSATQAQTFVSKGKIEYEKKVNLHSNLENDSWSQMIMKTLPKFKTTYFDLFFDNGKTVYKPGKDVIEPVKIPDWVLGPANDNTVFTDLEKQTVTAQKTVFDGTYLLNDSTRKLDWKITNDTRTIAGFECRKATAIIMDSIFVVAFYTDQILATGGPESFNGLPGMILGLAIPRLHATWYATKLEMVQVKETDLAAPSKGKKINKTELNSKLADAMKNWGKEGTRNIWQVML